MKSQLLRRTLAIILLTIILSAILTGVVFSILGRNVFASMKAEELYPRADYIAYLAAEFLQERMSSRAFLRVLNNDNSIWDASVFVLDSSGTTLVMPAHGEDDPSTTLMPYLPSVLLGRKVYEAIDSKGGGVIIGSPVFGDDGNVIGAVFLTKPIREVNAALNSMMTALLISMGAVLVIMLIPAYFGSRGITGPLNQMSVVARAMENGDFSVRAEAKGTGEVAQLGQALNSLSIALKSTIDDLTLERNRLRSILDGLGEGIIAVDRDGSVTHFNPACLNLLGIKPDEEVGSSEIFERIKQSAVEAAQRREPATQEIVLGEVVLCVKITPLPSDNGENSGAVVLLRDVTENNRLERTRKEYVANVSHELRTPIASIRSLADALNDGLIKKEEDRSRYYGYILRESMRLSRLINDLLELSRLQSGTLAFSMRRVNTYEMLCDVAERFDTMAQESGLSLEFAVDESCPATYTNEDRAEQVLVALMDNAIKYCTDEGKVVLGARIVGQKLEISVSNDGEIAPEDIEHIFDRFYKVDKSHSGSGTGLGLSIACEVLALMDERIWAQSDGGRVTFTFTVQLA